MKSIKFILLVSCCIQQLIAQEVCVTIKSSKDSSSVEYVDIFILSTKKDYISNKDGISCFSSNQEELLLISHPDYFSQQVSVSTNKTIYLLPRHVELKASIISDKKDDKELAPTFLRKVEKMFFYHGKKSERIQLDQSKANLATNNSRQIYGNVSGLNYIETSSAGLGTEIGVRGLSPERSSNLNIRQNGYDISADALGYPDAYYVPPGESIERIESVRGAGALQYGTQFGGMINYIKKKAPINFKRIGYQGYHTYGSYQFLNTYNSIYGRNGKGNFYAYGSYKKGNDWKPNSAFNSKNAYFQGELQLARRLLLNVEYTHFYYLTKQPGGLTDAMFENDPSTSIRDRNWFSVAWNLPSATLFYKPSPNREFQTKFFSLFANRKALGFLGNITRIDPLQERDYLLDKYQNFGNETKWLQRYTVKDKLNLSILGIRVYRGNTVKQQGLANDLSGPDFYYLNPDSLEGSDYQFPSWNLALFGENMIYLTNRLSITAGLRSEYIKTTADGYYRVTNTDLAGNVIFDTIINEQKQSERSFILGSLGMSYEGTNYQLYANFSQNYRAINFNDLRINNVNFQVDPKLEDERGYNADIGIRGKIKKVFTYDVSLFYLRYANRIGFVLKTDPQLFNLYRFRTNISASRNIGIESLFQIDWKRLMKPKAKHWEVKTSVSASYIDGRYVQSEESAIEGKKVELIPSTIVRGRAEIGYKSWFLTTQLNYTGEQYTDATNAEFASNAISGIIPAFMVVDASVGYKNKRFSVTGNINNLLDNDYFTKRAVGYPGPGIIPAPPRMFYITLGLTL